jgi:hypothetical protein
LRENNVAAIVNPEDLAKNQIFLVLASAGFIRECNIGIIKELSTLGFHSVVITTNFPYSVLRKLYEQDGVDLTQVTFIDAVTQSHHVSGNAETAPGTVRYISNPANLTDMGIAVTEVLKEHHSGKVCILFDSISTLLIYLPSQNISKFIHFVTNKLRLMDISGVFLAVEKGLDPMLMSQLTTFVDTVIDTK